MTQNNRCSSQKQTKNSQTAAKKRECNLSYLDFLATFYLVANVQSRTSEVPRATDYPKKKSNDNRQDFHEGELALRELDSQFYHSGKWISSHSDVGRSHLPTSLITTNDPCLRTVSQLRLFGFKM